MLRIFDLPDLESQVALGVLHCSIFTSPGEV